MKIKKAINDFAEKLCIEIEEARLKYQRLTKESGDDYDEVMDIYFNGFKKLVREIEKEMMDGDEE